jgi:V/A-type H+-transporting ATPase subunit E
MALADIKTKIENEAQAEIKALLAEADEEVARIRAKADAEVKAIRGGYSERFGREQPEILRRREIVANLDVARIQLGTKRELIEKAYEEALHLLARLPEDKYLGFVHRLMAKAVVTGEEVVYVGKNETKITDVWLNHFNSTQNTKLSLASERLPIAGGFVLRNGRVDTNCSWEMLIRWVRDDLEAEVVKRLLPSNYVAQ